MSFQFQQVDDAIFRSGGGPHMLFRHGFGGTATELLGFSREMHMFMLQPRRKDTLCEWLRFRMGDCYYAKHNAPNNHLKSQHLYQVFLLHLQTTTSNPNTKKITEEIPVGGKNNNDRHLLPKSTLKYRVFPLHPRTRDPCSPKSFLQHQFHPRKFKHRT